MEEALNRKALTWGMLCHLSALSGIVGIPFGHLLGPLLVWLLKRNEFPFVDAQGKESLNFQISMTIYALIALFLVFSFIGIPAFIVLALLDVVFVIAAAVKANSGKAYRYPLTLRIIK
ncbi:MAG: DUF4870 domain-containing protein [Thermodesulfovibrionales bacterium]